MLKRIFLSLLTALLMIFSLSNSAPAQEKKGPAFSILIDNSIALQKRFPQVLMLGKVLVRRFHTRGPVSLYSFVQGYDDLWGRLLVATPNVEWSKDEEALQGHLNDIALVKGYQKNLYDAVRSIAVIFNTQAESEGFGEKVIILVTDGEDSVYRRNEGPAGTGYDIEDNNRKSRNQAIKFVKENGIKVYAIGLTQALDGGGIIGSSPKAEAEDFLRKITKETGGKAVFPRSDSYDVDSLVEKLFAK